MPNEGGKRIGKLAYLRHSGRVEIMRRKGRSGERRGEGKNITVQKERRGDGLSEVGRSEFRDFKKGPNRRNGEKKNERIDTTIPTKQQKIAVRGSRRPKNLWRKENQPV